MGPRDAASGIAVVASTAKTMIQSTADPADVVLPRTL
jgi:hypothetical protein